MTFRLRIPARILCKSATSFSKSIPCPSASHPWHWFWGPTLDFDWILPRWRHYFSPWELVKDLWGRSLRPWKYPVPNLPVSLASTDDLCPNQSFPNCLKSGDFSISMTLLPLTSQQPAVNCNPAHSSHHLFSSPLWHVLICSLSVRTHGFLFYSTGCNPLLSQSWPVRAPSYWLLCPLVWPHCCFWHFLVS